MAPRVTALPNINTDNNGNLHCPPDTDTSLSTPTVLQTAAEMYFDFNMPTQANTNGIGLYIGGQRQQQTTIDTHNMQDTPPYATNHIRPRITYTEADSSTNTNTNNTHTNEYAMIQSNCSSGYASSVSIYNYDTQQEHTGSCTNVAPSNQTEATAQYSSNNNSNNNNNSYHELYTQQSIVQPSYTSSVPNNEKPTTHHHHTQTLYPANELSVFNTQWNTDSCQYTGAPVFNSPANLNTCINNILPDTRAYDNTGTIPAAIYESKNHINYQTDLASDFNNIKCIESADAIPHHDRTLDTLSAEEKVSNWSTETQNRLLISPLMGIEHKPPIDSRPGSISSNSTDTYSLCSASGLDESRNENLNMFDCNALGHMKRLESCSSSQRLIFAKTKLQRQHITSKTPKGSVSSSSSGYSNSHHARNGLKPKKKMTGRERQIYLQIEEKKQLELRASFQKQIKDLEQKRDTLNAILRKIVTTSPHNSPELLKRLEIFKVSDTLA